MLARTKNYRPTDKEPFMITAEITAAVSDDDLTETPHGKTMPDL